MNGRIFMEKNLIKLNDVLKSENKKKYRVKVKLFTTCSYAEY